MPVKRGAVGIFVIAMIAALIGLGMAGTAQAAGAVVRLPDLQTVIPTDSFSVVTTSTGKEFRYTHLIYNSGPGPLEVQPQYDQISGQYRGTQEIYAQDASNHWSLASTHQVADVFVYHAEHGHFHFPLASFGLYQVAPGGGIGAPVAMSPKVGFCIDDSYIYDSTVLNAGAFVGTRGSCADPTSLRGLSVGAVDEYDYRDPGQAIPFDGVPDGTYWFRAVTDPNNDFVEANESNNETDVQVTVSGSTVTVGKVLHPDTTPPTGSLQSPADGSTVSGVTTLQAAPPAGVSRVDFLADGTIIGSATAAPYSFNWDTSGAINGVHWLAARFVDSAGRIGTSPVSAVTVANGGPPATGQLAVGGTTSSDGNGTVTTSPLTGLRGGEVLACFVSSDGPGDTAQTAQVSGGGLTWSLVQRANAQPGTSEIWTATLPAGQTSIAATSTPAHAGFDQSVTLTAFENSAGIGASAAGGAATGAPQVTLTTTAAGSFVFGAGNDWDRSVTRILGAGQSVVHEWVDAAVGDTFWVQRQSSAVPASSTTVSIDDTSPTADRWNLAAVEVTPAPSGPDTTPPAVSITDPADGTTVSGTVTVAATAADDVGVTSVQFTLDGTNLGAPATSPPFRTTWNTTAVPAGTHVLGAVATDAAGNQGIAAPVTVTVDNSAPPPAVISFDTKVNRHARSTLTSPTFATKAPGELLVAFVAMDGPAAARAQRATVRGAGLTWSLVKRSNSQSGDAEIWAATAPAKLTGATVTATPLRSGYDGQLTVMAFGNAAGTNIASSAGAPRGAASIYLPGTAAGSWCFAVGTDPDRALGRTLTTGQMLQSLWLDTGAGDTFWVQSKRLPNAVPGLVTLSTTAPTSDQWNLAAVEIVAKPSA